LRALLRRGRVSLAIGLVFLSACVLAGDLAAQAISPSGMGEIVRQGLTVAGWVAMWRPMEIFLYSWWPLLGDRRLYDRLGRMPVCVEPGHTGADGRATEATADVARGQAP
jgi:ABC-type spermidine/putrescine transport system permease subunit I